MTMSRANQLLEMAGNKDFYHDVLKDLEPRHKVTAQTNPQLMDYYLIQSHKHPEEYSQHIRSAQHAIRTRGGTQLYNE